MPETQKKLEYKKEIYVVTAEDTTGNQWHCFKDELDTLQNGEVVGVYQFVKEAVVKKEISVEFIEAKE